uniref:Serine/threonine-protein kinase Nek5-like isoform X1 n=1 Tax=Rhizophora mucronata TaxID=61149 RepID=A0A2P2MBG5_RHIMU
MLNTGYKSHFLMSRSPATLRLSCEADLLQHILLLLGLVMDKNGSTESSAADLLHDLVLIHPRLHSFSLYLTASLSLVGCCHSQRNNRSIQFNQSINIEKTIQFITIFLLLLLPLLLLLLLLLPLPLLIDRSNYFPGSFTKWLLVSKFPFSFPLFK